MNKSNCVTVLDPSRPSVRPERASGHKRTQSHRVRFLSESRISSDRTTPLGCVFRSSGVTVVLLDVNLLLKVFQVVSFVFVSCEDRIIRLFRLASDEGLSRLI